ncbi:MAG: DUF4271 domain-containing protein [Paludibacteraceae bacterium]|nr:DUF4271 domain-containing protein [Paludibacteraceae bacterium]
MINEIAHIISPVSAPWCAWMLLGLLICGVLSEWLQPGVVSSSFSSLLSRAERTYKAAPNNFFGQLLVTLFRVGCLSLALYLAVWQGGAFDMRGFFVIAAVVLCVLLIKMLCYLFLKYVLAISAQFTIATEHYSNLFTLAMVFLYPVLLFLFYVGSSTICLYVLCVLAALFLIVWLIKSARLFIISPMGILYFLLYIATLEVLPMGGLYYLSAKTVLYL